MITRSGTNGYHGNLFEYLRNTALNANDFFNNSSGQPRPKLVMNTFGGSAGGYVRIPNVYNGRDRTFFFFNYQGQRVAQEMIRNRLVPTEAARRGIFRWQVPGTNELRSFDIVANDPRRIGIDRQVAATLPLIPLPNNTDIGDGLNVSGFRFNQPSPRVEDQWTAKFDHNLNQNGGRAHRLYYRLSYRTFSQSFFGADLGSTYPGQPAGAVNRPGWGFAAGWNAVWKPWLVNEFLLGYQTSSLEFAYTRPKGPVIMPFSWFNPIQSGFYDLREPPVTQLTDNLSILRGEHSFKTGFTLHFTNQHTANEAGLYPNVLVSRNGATPPATVGPTGATISLPDRTRFENLYNDLLGRVSSINKTFYSDSETFQPAGSPRVRNFRFHDYGYFFQDDWRIRPNLTLNLGLRWEFFGTPVERDRLQGVLKQAARINSVNQISDVVAERGTQWYANDWNNFAPRFGFAWDPFGNGKMSIRASYGLFYDRVIGADTLDVDGRTPGFSQQVTSFPNATAGSDVRLSADNPLLPSQPSTPLVRPANDRTFVLSLWDPRFRTPYVHQFNFSIQGQVLRGTVVEAAYVGNRGVKLNNELNLNQGRIDGDFLAAFKEIAAFRNGGRNNGPAVAASNTLARIFGSVDNAVSALNGTNFDQGQAGAAAQLLDVNNYARYAAAGVPDFYIRNYPQFNAVFFSTNAGRSYYDSMQLSVRRRKGTLGLTANYTWSKSIDNSSIDGFAGPIDSFNLALNRGRSTYDRPHTLTWTATYSLPIGRNRLVGSGMPEWLDRIAAGWDLGSVGTWMSGPTMTVSSGLQTAGLSVTTWANYNDTDRDIGAVDKRGDGVFFWTPAERARFGFPGAGEIGTSGRNAFRGPGQARIDLSLGKRFRLSEGHSVSFRAEAYNLLNHANFAPPGLSPLTPASFGKISATIVTTAISSNARTMQFALRYDF